MAQLLLFVLLPIGLLDSLSMVPLCVVPLGVLLGSARPYMGVAGLLGGILLIYGAGGALILLGLDALEAWLTPILARWWSDPSSFELVVQVTVGAVLLIFGWRLSRARSEAPTGGAPPGLTPGSAFTLGAGLTLAGLPGALPYFGAIDQIVRADLSPPASAAALIFYNLAFLLPIASPVLLRLLVPSRSDAISRSLVSLSERFGRRIVALILSLLGAVFTADAIGWFLGVPLFPLG